MASRTDVATGQKDAAAWGPLGRPRARTTADQQAADPARCCYLPATTAYSSYGCFAGTPVRSSSNRLLGVVDGFIIEAAARRVRQLVVETCDSGTRRRHLLPLASTVARIERGSRSVVMEIDGGSLEDYTRLEAGSFAPFGDEDFLAALFSANRGQ